MPRSPVQLACVALAATVALMALIPPVQAVPQNSSRNSARGQTSAPVALVNSVRIVNEHGAPALEIMATHPIVPDIQTLDSPTRLVVDLPYARLGQVQKRIPVNGEAIAAIRTEQYRQKPPVTRIVVDLSGPYGYTWDAAGNRLMIRLKPPGDTNHEANTGQSNSLPPLAAPTLASADAPAVVPVSGGPGTVVLAGSRIGAGASVTAGSETAVLALSRGGEIRVCPGTTVSVTPSKSKHELMLGMSSGALEAHYALDAAADSILTPDFRILLAGPGEFHYAISADLHGNTCVRALMGNTASVMVSELMGDRIYQVKPNEQAVFRSGRIDKVDTDIPLECGCPPPAPAMLANTSRANTPAPTPAPDADLPEKATLGSASAPAGNLPAETVPVKGDPPDRDPSDRESSGAVLSHGPETDPLPRSQPGEVHIQVDAPFVFSGRKKSAELPAVLVHEIASLPLEDSSRRMLLETVVQAPRQKHPLLHRLKRFFVAVFG
ncbi:MAG: AMIN domain-containing protein [Candidatus Sulfotelmatobacter sp.]